MNLKFFLISQLLLFYSTSLISQVQKLQSTKYGLHMMLGDVSKEQLVDEMRFEDGKDEKVDVVRFDYIGSGEIPLIISSKLPVATDSLGILAFRLHPDSLINFLGLISHVYPKFHERKFDDLLIRITYRFHGNLEQYYLTNRKITTEILKMIQKKLIDNKDKDALGFFYRWVGATGLLVQVDGKLKWKY